MLIGLHHIAIICSDITASKAFYTQVLGCKIEREVYREKRDSWKIDLSLHGTYVIELFSFPDSPPRASYPEAIGLRHIAFTTNDIVSERERLIQTGLEVEEIRTDEFTGKEYCFFSDPDGLPIELYQW